MGRRRAAETPNTRSENESAARSVDAAETQLGAVATSAERVLYTAVGALATAADAVRQSALTYTNSERLARELNQFERRGARALDRSRRKVRSRVR